MCRSHEYAWYKVVIDSTTRVASLVGGRDRNKKKIHNSSCSKTIEKTTNNLLTLTGTHSHLMQYITPNGGPRSAYQVDPSSRSVFPKWHSEKYKLYKVIIKKNEEKKNWILIYCALGGWCYGDEIFHVYYIYIHMY